MGSQVIAGITDSKTALGHAVAKKALMVLNRIYPGFVWYARCDGGLLIIKCNALGNACMNRHIRQIDYDDKFFTRDIVMAAGEFLERGYLKRGKWDGSYAEKLDGGAKFRWKSVAALMNALQSGRAYG